MALWHLFRMETDPNVGPVALTCVSGENPIKFTLYDSDNAVYDATIACVPEADDAAHVLTILTNAGYSPNEWD